jgi:hypothetical protein
MDHPAGAMTTDLLAGIRRLFGKPMPTRKLERALAGWRAGERPGVTGSAVKREVLHPMKGWVIDSADRVANDTNPPWKVRHAAHQPTRAK